MGLCISTGGTRRSSYTDVTAWDPRRALSQALYAIQIDGFTSSELLGTGSWGAVYRATRLADLRTYAIKCTDLTELNSSQAWLAVNEARLLSSLDHPAVLGCHAVFVEGGRLCLVLEHVPDGDLAGLIARHAAAGTHVPEAQVWGVLLQLAAALAHLHASRVVHRDVKPANVLLDGAGGVKLADFGIAGYLKEGHSTCHLGSAQYMSPEISTKGQLYGLATDIWSLGTTLHELCTLCPLFTGATEAEVECRVARALEAGSPLPPLPPCYSPALGHLVAAMLSFDPKQLPTAAQLLASPAIQAAAAPSLPERLRAALPRLLTASCKPAELLPPIDVCGVSPTALAVLAAWLPPPRWPAPGSSVGDSSGMEAHGCSGGLGESACVQPALVTFASAVGLAGSPVAAALAGTKQLRNLVDTGREISVVDVLTRAAESSTTLGGGTVVDVDPAALAADHC